MQIFTLKKILLFTALSLLAACGSDKHQADKLTEVPGPVTSSGGSNFSPTGSSSPTPPATPAKSNCTETGPVTFSATAVDFGTSQKSIDDKHPQCEVITTTSCGKFSVEIENDSVSEQFGVSKGSSVALSDSGLSGSFKICYQRTEVDTHNGILKIFMDSGKSTFVLPLTGETLPRFFTVDQPVPHQFVWEKDPGPAVNPAKGEDAPYLKAYQIQASGQINLDLEKKIKKTSKGDLFTISVKDGGQTIPVSADVDGTFSTPIEIPETGGVYSVIFRATLKDGKTLEEIIPVIRYTEPSATVEIRDDQGNQVKTADKDDAKETDSPQLTAGIAITNLNASGPAGNNQVRVQVRILKPQGNTTVPYLWFSADKKSWVSSSLAAKPVSLFLNQTRDSNDPLKCKDAFTKPQKDVGGSICVGLPLSGKLETGVNIIEVTACNGYTDFKGGDCKTIKTSLIIDNELPRIHVDRPLENQVYSIDKDIILRGTIENFAPPTSKDEKITCNVKFWLNTSVDKDPLPGCLENITVLDGAYDGLHTGNQGNLRRANFYINLSKLNFKDKDNKTVTSDDLLTLYTNLVRIEATNSRGHTAIKVVSFQRGEFKASSFKDNSSGKGDLSTGSLGVVTNTGKLTRAPLMLNISEGTLQDPALIAALEKFANDNVKLQDLIQGYTPTADGNIPADITPNPHLSGVAKVMYWVDPKKNNRKNLKPSDTNNSCDFNTQGTCAAILFPKNFDDERLFGAGLANEDFWAPVVFGTRNNAGQLIDKTGKPIPVKNNGFPINSYEMSKIVPDYNFDDVQQGKLTIDKLDLRNDGNIDVKATIHGFKGHAYAFAMCEYGSLSFPPVIPFNFNLETLTVKLVLGIKKIQLDKNGKELFTSDKDEHGNFIPANQTCKGGKCAHKLIFDPSTLKLTGTEAQQGMITIASDDCTDTSLGALYTTEKKYDYMGCHNSQKLQNLNHPKNYWAVGETRVNASSLSKTIGPSLLPQLQDVLRGAIHDIVTCDMPKSLVNPLFDEVAFPYPAWMPESQKLFKEPDTFDLNDDLKLTVVKTITAEGTNLNLDIINKGNALFGMTSTLKELDLAIRDGGIDIKLPVKSLISKHITTPGNDPAKKTLGNSEITRFLGSVYRHPEQANFDSAFPRREITDDPYVSVSLNVEEVVNSVAHLIWRKGKDDLLELFGEVKTKLTPPPGAQTDAWTLGIDKVILGRFDICNSIAGKLLSPNLPAKLLFSKVALLFGKTPDLNNVGLKADDITHWDLRLDPAQPPTLALQPVPGDPDSTYIQLGLSNVQIDVRDLMVATQNEKLFNVIGDKILTLRVDAVLKLKAHYDDNSRKLDLYILPYSEQTLYASVIDGGAAYNDKDVINDFVGYLLVQSFERLKSTEKPSLSIRLPAHLSQFNNLETFTIDNDESEDAKKAQAFSGIVIENRTRLGKNDSCKGLTPPAYLGVVYDAPKDNDTKSKLIISANPECNKSEEMQTNQISSSLCEAGLQEVTLGDGYPHLMLDSANGYIHLSTSLFFKIYDWLAEEVTP